MAVTMACRAVNMRRAAGRCLVYFAGCLVCSLPSCRPCLEQQEQQRVCLRLLPPEGSDGAGAGLQPGAATLTLLWQLWQLVSAADYAGPGAP
ncbi:hypothetical protein HaLaN_23935 [Haematococcus lacustris]|uniref:Uncharacterized protein n=1 Tax=Haematococcus lacustris TaxID=44745 RepID=A0A6A0A4L9_HAELA|nr:hypothetical protein HaLaN_23935 [Haematococcus lacustris]